jgi:hypothetical protein
MTGSPAAGARTSKALAAWTELNDRQQGTLAVIYELDQEAEAAHRRAGARREFSRASAASWRAIDFAHDPSLRDLVGWTEMQTRLERRGWDNQGNGSTVAALTSRGLIRRGSRPTDLGIMATITLTTDGRAAARAGTAMPGTPRAALSHRAWEVLALLWAAGKRGEPLKWGHSTTIEHVLISKHVPPLAEDVPGGYAITDRGRWFYREHYAACAAAHPDVNAPHPDGTEAEPWPPQADEILTQHRRYYRALCAAWQDASTARQGAEKEAAAAPAEVPEGLPAVAEQAAMRHQLWHDTARQRAELAAAHAEDLRTWAQQAARAYAVAALAAFRAAALRSDPLDVLQPPGEADAWDEQRLAPPAETGIYAIDAEARKLHAAAVGAPLARRGPAPKRRSRYASLAAPSPELPGSRLAALADFLHGHADGGALMRRLHGAHQGAQR